MISKKLKKLIAVMVCLGFITVTFSGVALAVDKKVVTSNPDVMKTFLQKPMHLLNSLLSAFLGPNPKVRGGTIEKSNSSSKIIKTTGNLKSVKLSEDD